MAEWSGCLFLIERSAFRLCLFVCMFVSRLQQHAATDYHAIWNQNTWYKVGVTYVKVFLNGPPVSKWQPLCGYFTYNSNGLQAMFTVHKNTSNLSFITSSTLVVLSFLGFIVYYSLNEQANDIFIWMTKKFWFYKI